VWEGFVWFKPVQLLAYVHTVENPGRGVAQILKKILRGVTFFCRNSVVGGYTILCFNVFLVTSSKPLLEKLFNEIKLQIGFDQKRAQRRFGLMDLYLFLVILDYF
jgi:hypothetical protein